MDVVYLDNAATSWPKPVEVTEAMTRAIVQYGANPGRGSHRMAMEASKALFVTRKKLADLFGIRNPNDIAFTVNTTAALNLAIMGFVKTGDHVVCTAVEHNAVRRPLEWLRENKGVRVTYVEASASGEVDPLMVKRCLEPKTRLVIVNHSSNLLGSIAPLEQISEIVKLHDAKLLVDAAQTAGVLPIDVIGLGIDMLAFPGHKGLYGPQGTGGLYIAPDLDVEPIVFGGTGSQSEALTQPNVRPDRYESGTLNTPGIAGLGAGVDFVVHETVANIHNKEWGLTQRLMEGVLAIPGVRVLGPGLGQERTGIAAFTMKGLDCSELSFILDQHFGIAVRAGYHCTPLAHETAGTLGTGAVRASVGAYTTIDQVDYLITALKQIRESFSM